MKKTTRCGKCINCIRIKVVQTRQGEQAARDLSDKFNCIGKSVKASTIRHQE